MTILRAGRASSHERHAGWSAAQDRRRTGPWPALFRRYLRAVARLAASSAESARKLGGSPTHGAVDEPDNFDQARQIQALTRAVADAGRRYSVLEAELASERDRSAVLRGISTRAEQRERETAAALREATDALEALEAEFAVVTERLALRARQVEEFRASRMFQLARLVWRLRRAPFIGRRSSAR